ncbi:MAG: hypothetical protein KA751_01195 [Comamonas sp.]|nr:hypothetical protein [Comamonas sp.]
MEEVQLYVLHPEKINTFGLRKLEHQAGILAKTDAAASSTVRAAIAAFRWDAEGVEYWTNNALKLEKSFATLTNAAVNKGLVGDVRAAAEYALEAFHLATSDANAASNACDALMFDGRFDEALAIANRFINSSDAFGVIAKDASAALDALAKLEIEQDEVRRQIEIGVHVAANLHTTVSAIENFVVNDYEDGSRFVISLHVIGDIHKEIALDEALVEKLLDDPMWDPMKLSIEFHYLTDAGIK